MSTLFNKRVIVGEIGGKKEVSPDHVFQGKLVKCVLGAFFFYSGANDNYGAILYSMYQTVCVCLCVCCNVNYKFNTNQTTIGSLNNQFVNRTLFAFHSVFGLFLLFSVFFFVKFLSERKR